MSIYITMGVPLRPYRALSMTSLCSVASLKKREINGAWDVFRERHTSIPSLQDWKCLLSKKFSFCIGPNDSPRYCVYVFVWLWKCSLSHFYWTRTHHMKVRVWVVRTHCGHAATHSADTPRHTMWTRCDTQLAPDTHTTVNKSTPWSKILHQRHCTTATSNLGCLPVFFRVSSLFQCLNHIMPKIIIIII